MNIQLFVRRSIGDMSIYTISDIKITKGDAKTELLFTSNSGETTTHRVNHAKDEAILFTHAITRAALGTQTVILLDNVNRITKLFCGEEEIASGLSRISRFALGDRLDPS